jgi:hypothetical protein
LPLLFNFALEYVIRKVQENEEAFKAYGTLHFVVYAKDDNTVGENINIVKNTEAL